MAKLAQKRAAGRSTPLSQHTGGLSTLFSHADDEDAAQQAKAIVDVPLRRFEKDAKLKANTEDVQHLLPFLASGLALQNESTMPDGHAVSFARRFFFSSSEAPEADGAGWAIPVEVTSTLADAINGGASRPDPSGKQGAATAGAGGWFGGLFGGAGADHVAEASAGRPPMSTSDAAVSSLANLSADMDSMASEAGSPSGIGGNTPWGSTGDSPPSGASGPSPPLPSKLVRDSRFQDGRVFKRTHINYSLLQPQIETALSDAYDLGSLSSESPRERRKASLKKASSAKALQKMNAIFSAGQQANSATSALKKLKRASSACAVASGATQSPKAVSKTMAVAREMSEVQARSAGVMQSRGPRNPGILGSRDG